MSETKVPLSPFLKEQKPFLKALINKLSKTFDYVSILGADSFSTSYSVSRSGISVYEDSLCNERGFVLRVHNGIGYSEYSFNELDEAAIISAITDIALNDVKAYEKTGISFCKLPIIHEEELSKEFTGSVAIAFESETSEQKISRLVNIREKALSLSEAFLDFTVSFQEVTVKKMFLSNKKDLEQSYCYSIGYFISIAKNNDKVVSPFSTFSNWGGLELLDEMENAVETEAKKALEYLEAERLVPGTYEVICSPEVTGLIAHEAFGHGVEMDMFVKDRAKAKDFVNKAVASQITEMHDGAATHHKEVSSYYFDDEGVLANDTIVIKNGILQQGICDTLSSLALGVKPTGNGKRQSYQRKAYTRMTNTFFSPGTESLDEMIKSISFGYLLTDYMSGMEDPKNWGIQCCLGKAYEIKDGKITGKVFSPVYLTGYVPDLLKSFSSISKEGDFKLSGSGFCGKGYKEYVRTSSGGSYIKAKANLS